ncbi:MAG: 16S rRNA (uracil(1498)-N(3))-methyltransferase [Myxococcota bacterium]
MNLLLVEPHEVVEPGLARVGGRKARHLRAVLGKGQGDALRVGELGGRVGSGLIEQVTGGEAWVRYQAEQAPPLACPVQLVLALPRPPMLRRILGHVTALGVKRLVLLHTARVEKSFWDSRAVGPDAIRAQLLLGLEQARDTVLPEVTLAPRFRPFVEDQLGAWAGPGRRLVADPAGGAATGSVERTTAVVGPEGGLIPFELGLLAKEGFGVVSLGPRILRVETAVVALTARLAGGEADR